MIAKTAIGYPKIAIENKIEPILSRIPLDAYHHRRHHQIIRPHDHQYCDGDIYNQNHIEQKYVSP